MTRTEEVLKRLFICIWLPGFMVTMCLAFIISPFVWLPTGKWPCQWLFENAEPFELYEDWFGDR